MKAHRVLLCIVAVVAFATATDASDRILRTEMTVDAPLEQVWKAWTTEKISRRDAR